jgi:NADPH-dependent ferric siderophore reductase
MYVHAAVFEARSPMPTVERVRHQPRTRLLEVSLVERLTPRMVRISLRGEDFGDFRSSGADDHVKLMFAVDGSDRPALPNPDPAAPRFPDGVTPPVMRDFTPRRFDADAGELVIDFVLHGDGPAASWAANAVAGSLVGQGGPRGSLVVSDDFDWYLLAGDETALPSIARRLEELPPTARAIVIAEVAGEDDELALETRAALEMRWLHRGDAEPGSSDLLERAIRDLALPDGEGFAWVATEAESARRLRTHLRDERGLPKAWTRITGYWKRGAADHHDPPDTE